MVETVYTTPTGVKLLKNGYGMLFSSNIDEIKISLTKDTYGDDYYKTMTAIDLLDEIDHQTTLKPKIEKTQIDGIVPNGIYLLSGLDSDGHFINVIWIQMMAMAKFGHRLKDVIILLILLKYMFNGKSMIICQMTKMMKTIAMSI